MSEMNLRQPGFTYSACGTRSSLFSTRHGLWRFLKI